MSKKRGALAAIIVVAAMFLTGCTDTGSNAQESGQKLTEQAYEQQSKAVPYPADKLRDSLERRNLKERLLRTNQPNRLGYVYLLTSMGDFLGYYTIKGKVSSNQSQMTTSQLLVKNCTGCSERSVVTAPGDDGSYGENEQGIFFFTTDGVMVSTNANYIYSDAPLAVDAPELLK